MLSEILSKKECARCRICCSFDSGDLWETPVITPPLKDKILSEISPNQKFLEKDGAFLLKLECEPDEDLYICTMLDKEKGCMLGEEKPFECRIWPFRVMNFGDELVITISPVCPTLFKKPINELADMAEKLSPLIFEEAKKRPVIVKPYIKGYPILKTQ